LIRKKNQLIKALESISVRVGQVLIVFIFFQLYLVFILSTIYYIREKKIQNLNLQKN